MRIALLTTDLLIADWFANTYPHITVCCKADERFWEAECMIITSYYHIKDEYVQILRIWEQYLRIRKPSKKLIVLGWSDFYAPNYLQIDNMPESLDREWYIKIRKEVDNQNFTCYPSTPDRDLLSILEKVIHSHGERPLKKLLYEIQNYLSPIERAVRADIPTESLLKMEQTIHVGQLMKRLRGVWEDRHKYFELTPQYLELREMELILTAWDQLLADSRIPTPSLSQLIIQYNKKTLKKIVRFYNIEKES